MPVSVDNPLILNVLSYIRDGKNLPLNNLSEAVVSVLGFDSTGQGSNPAVQPTQLFTLLFRVLNEWIVGEFRAKYSVASP